MSQVSLSQQLKEGNLFAEQCPSREVLKHVTSRWGVLILVAPGTVFIKDSIT